MFNARSLRNKFSDLEVLAASEDYEIIGVTESWLNTQNRDFLAEFKLPGYSMFSCERGNRSGGGVLFFVKASLHPTVVEKEKIINLDKIFIQLNVRSKKIILGLVYRPPAHNPIADRKLYEQLTDISDSIDSVFIGDFNLPVTLWGNPLTSHMGHELYNSLLESALNQHVSEPTRGENILDLNFSTNDALISNVNIGPEFSTSDHKLVTFDINLEVYNINPSSEVIFLYKRGDFDKLRAILSEIDWNIVLQGTCVDEAWKLFISTLNNAVKSCVPVSKRRSQNNNKPRWWNNQIKNKLTLKKRAYIKYRATNDESDKIEYVTLRREVKKLINQSKKNLETYIASISKSNPKEFYGYIRKKKVITAKIGPLRLENGEYAYEDDEIADTLNKYFASVFTKENENRIDGSAHRQTNVALSDNFNFSEEAVFKVLDVINVNKTPGPDGISPRVLKEAKNQICKPLSIIFNKSFNSGKVPDDWKLANVTPIQKKGDKSQPCNYRPISLTSVVCKVMETIIRDKIVKFLEVNELIKNSQHGFRNKRSCLTNLLDFYNDVFNIYDESKAVDIIYLDFQKAFDTVPHKRLLTKLQTHGVTGKFLNWMEDWLSDRKQRVVVNGKSSNWRNVISGVPQGSVLGPVLFITYINDIDEGLNCKISKFADDTKITGRVTTASERLQLQSDLDRLVNWSSKWQMKFNLDKCKVLHIGYHNTHSNYSMDGFRLTEVNQEKDLGITISNDLKHGKHCSEVVKTANKLVGFIGRAFEFKSEKVILTLYNALVRPHLEYCVQFWSPYYRKDIDKLERVQRRVTKLIPRLRNKPYEERLKELNLFSLSKRRLRGDLIEVFKMFRGFDNVNINDYVVVDRTSTTRSNGFKINGKHFRSEEAKHFFFNRIVNVWNSLPAHVVNSNTVATFKTRLDKYLAANPHLSYFAPS